MSSTLSVLEQIGHCHWGVCSLTSNQVVASKHAMCSQCAERIGISMRV